MSLVHVKYIASITLIEERRKSNFFGVFWDQEAYMHWTITLIIII